jgi:hypothetical protein
MEVLSLALMAAAAGKALDAVLGQGLVSAAIGGVIGNRADALVCHATRSSWSFFRDLRTKDPALNHDLERGTREAYLLATLELLRQAEDRVRQSGTRLLSASDAEALAALRQGAEADLRDVANTLPEPIADAHLFLVDPDLAPADRLARMRQTMRANLDADATRWLGRGGRLPTVVEALLESGWTIDTSLGQTVPRDWHSLIALAFVEKLKTTPRLAAIFEAKMLAQIVARDAAAAPIGTFSGFTAQLDAVTVPLQRIEDALGVLGRDVSDIKAGVEDIKGGLASLDRSLRDAVGPRPRSISRGLVVAAAAALAAVAVIGYAVRSWTRDLDRDYRRLGWITPVAIGESDSPGRFRIRAEVWLPSAQIPLRDVTMSTLMESRSGRLTHAEHPALHTAVAGAGVVIVDFPAARDTVLLTACLAMPNRGLGERSRVTQTFSVPALAADGTGRVALTPLADPVVRTDPGGDCRPEL